MRGNRGSGILCLIGLTLWSLQSFAEEVEFISVSSVGVARKLDQVVLPGSKLQAKPVESRHSPFVLRIVGVYPHGSDHRYDFEYYALEPGLYNLWDYLTRMDSSQIQDDFKSTATIPPLWVQINATLPPGEMTLSPVPESELPWLNGYRATWIFGSIAWLAGLLALIFIGRSKNRNEKEVAATKLSLADQLRPLVKAACDRTLPSDQRALLERTLIAFWCERLQIGAVGPAAVMAILRQHDEAGPLLRSLEDWLHQPGAPKEVNLDSLLNPYKDIPISDIQSSDSSLPTTKGVSLL